MDGLQAQEGEKLIVFFRLGTVVCIVRVKTKLGLRLYVQRVIQIGVGRASGKREKRPQCCREFQRQKICFTV